MCNEVHSLFLSSLAWCVHWLSSCGYDGLIIESHYQPDTVLTDKFQHVTMQVVGDILGRWKASL